MIILVTSKVKEILKPWHFFFIVLKGFGVLPDLGTAITDQPQHIVFSKSILSTDCICASIVTVKLERGLGE